MASNSTTDYYLDYEDKFTLTLILFIFYATLYLPSSLLFFLRRNHHPIKLRGYELTLFHTFIPLLEITIRFFEDQVCVVKNIRGYLLVPLWIFPYFFRALNLWFRYNYHSLKTKRGSIFLASSTSSLPSKEGLKERVLDFLQDHPFFLSLKFPAVVLTVFFVFFGGSAALMTYLVGVDPLTCDANSSFAFFVVPIVVAFFLVLTFMYLLWNVHDPYLIKHEMSILLFLGLVIVPSWAAVFVFRMGIWDQFLIELAEISSSLVSLVYPLIGTFYYSKWLKISRKGRRKTDPEKESVNSFEREFTATMEHSALAAAFEQFTIECWNSENLLFYRMVCKLRDNPEEKGAIAKEIYDNFIAIHSRFQINIDSQLRRQIEATYQAKDISVEMFDKAEEHCLSLLKYSVFPLWKESSRLRECLKKLKLSSLEDFLEFRESIDLEELGVRVRSASSL